MDHNLKKFIEGMPKIELHLHIEGSLEPELAFEMAARKHVTICRKDGTPFRDVAEFKEACKFEKLDDFLELYYGAMSALKTEDDFYDLTMAYLKKAKLQNVTHTEIFFDPQQHMQNGIDFDTVIKGIHRALEDGEKMGISSKLIMSFLRHLPEQATAEEKAEKDFKDAFDTLEIARPYIKNGYIDGIGLDSSELPYPPHQFERVFAKAKELYPHLKLVAHAGEEGPPEYVRQALDILKVDRVDHGNRSLEDSTLVKMLIDRNMGLTVCPLSNLRLGGVDDMKKHSLRNMLDMGLKATVNSDDPAYFRDEKLGGGYITENFLSVAEALDLKRDHIIKLAQNAIDTSFLSPEEKAEKTKELQTYVAKADLMDKFVSPAVGQQIAV